ncbi:hypothetical protein LWI28_003983 [Acer negundo]|uniref:Uncharacterized protein n=1 Tax=Acer negundo TaxID=4023 RepID=A0AAD5J988_ACENE|nr:hypothetical protein LWI28_003983 [Acer negundo]KAK4852860.1 hypothetical protein QYF36_000279 [Acer negundo]
MTVAVLNPQDCLSKNYRFSKQPLISPMKDPRNSNPNFNNNRSNRVQQLPNRTKRSPPRSHRNSPLSRPAAPKAPPKTNLVMGQVKILKRGEDPSLTMAAQKPVSAEQKPASAEQKLVSAVQKPVSAEPEKKKKGGAVVQKRAYPDLGSTDRLGPEPGSVPIQIRLSESKNRAANFYAGSAFVTSPPPSSLPLPAFFTKKSVVTLQTDDATSDLRRILKLDML